MSSPIALHTKRTFRKIMIRLHQRLSHTHRIEVLSRKIAALIGAHYPNAQKIQCLDVGCGDMQIAEKIGIYNPNTAWNCIDVHDLPENLKKSERWAKYQKFDGSYIPFGKKSMDVVLFCDVLHHVQGNARNLLKEAARVGRIVIVKDHFSYSLYSRIMLTIMDFFGNWGYGVSLPKRYFSVQSFKELYSAAGLIAQKIDVGIDLYSRSFLLRHLLLPRWQFIAVLRSS